jgi:phosphoglycolate phosphatase
MNSGPTQLNLALVEAAIIDLDGTMVDTLPDFAVVLGAVLRELNLPQVTAAFIRRTIGKGSEHLIRTTLLEVGADAALYDRAWDLYQYHYLAVNGNHSSVYPGVAEGLEHFRARGWKLACLTNKPTVFARTLLQKMGLSNVFNVVLGGDAFERKKPDPLPLLRTCEILGSSPKRTLVIGDSSNDACAARAAGCPVLLVSYGYNHGEPVAMVDTDGIVDRLDCVLG